MGKLIRFVFFPYIVLVFSADIHEKRKHIHVSDKKLKRLCKFWLEREGKVEISLEYNYGFSNRELSKIKKLIKMHLETIMKQLRHFYSGNHVKTITL